MGQRAGFVLPVGVHHGKGRGEGFGPKVVVQDHHIAARRCNGVMRKRAAIDADNQIMRRAKRLHRRQQLTHAATTAAHTLRGGDGGSSSQGPSLRDSDS